MDHIVSFNNYNCYIFDLDNTLYDENSYLFSAYEEMALNLSLKYDIDAIIVKNFLVETFLVSGRLKLFNNLINSFKLPQSVLPDLLNILRNHKMINQISLFPELEVLIRKLIIENKSIFILTNGNVQQQKNKINQIDWKGIKKLKFVFANELVPKPSPEGVLFILKESNCKRDKVLFIGDSIVDEQCAHAANIDFLNISSILNTQ